MGDKPSTLRRQTLHFEETKTALTGDKPSTLRRRIMLKTIENKDVFLARVFRLC
jgi:hypothetical protein